MRLSRGNISYSPSDLCTFIESRFATWMDRFHLENPRQLEPDPPSEDRQLVQRKGNEHERATIEALRRDGADLCVITRDSDPFEATREAIQAGRPSIHQAALALEPFAGFADLLIKVEGASNLGDFHYVPRELKLAFTVKPSHVVQLCAYAEMLEALQGLRPDNLEVVLGNGERVELRTAEYFHYYTRLKADFLDYMQAFEPETRPVPDHGADHGRWTTHADDHLRGIDHLSRVANIRHSQIQRLEAAGITTMRELAETTLHNVSRVEGGTFDRLRRQARLQIESAGRERPAYEVMAGDPAGPVRGLALLPPPSPGDVFFDMEGYPLAEGGLEYLFGATYLERGDRRFRDGWAHDREQEKIAFESFIDWAHERWRADPTLHVYHYATYEETALRRLMGAHGTRELEVDQLLRNEVFVDLYTIVRHGLLVGEPRYSIKNLEGLFREARSGVVGTAIDSMVQYQRWMDSGEPADWRRSPILQGIRDYNRDDCDSTLMLAEWLRERQREHGIEFRGKTAEGEPKDPEEELSETVLRRQRLAEHMLQGEPDEITELLGHLLEFHRREDKPMWWELFARHAMSDQDLYDDLSCLGQLTRTTDPEESPARSKRVWYAFDPDQDTKLDKGKDCYLSHTLEGTVRIAEMNREQGRVLLRFGPKMISAVGWPPPERLSLIPDNHISSETIQASIERTASDQVDGGSLPSALEQFLRRLPPAVRGHEGGPLARVGESASDAAVRLVSAMDATTLSIQGPPGSGKTYTAARTILDLLGRGKRIGVTSNSHKAVLNLLARCAELNGEPLRCLKVGGDEDEPMLQRIPGIEHTGGGKAGAALAQKHSLIGGTAWLFSHTDMRGTLDYLFIDEAGQVSVANLAGMAPSATNLVLVGDQMQLAQPIQGSHPGASGASTLEYLLQGEPTIPPDRGLFLDVTYRLHPDICRVTSEAFYEGKLRPAPGCENRRIIVDETAKPGLPGAGIVFIPVQHAGNTQGSDEEAQVIGDLAQQLLDCEHTGRDGKPCGALSLDDILFVAPYNMQVRKLQTALPAGARVGSVDKFQGQEAPVVIISMCASEGHDSPRGIEFLMNPNRLNVALSRAQSLAIVVGHPGLARTHCSTITQMRLVNLYCRITMGGQ